MTKVDGAPGGSRPSAHAPGSLCLFFILLLASSAVTFSQDTEPSDDVLRVRTDLVTVPVYVTDSGGRRVAGLAQSDFHVLDNGRAVQLSYFAAGTEHVALCFALDTSGSIRELIAEQRDAALQLFKRFGRGSRVAVLRFGERATLTAPFTTAAEKAEAAFDSRPVIEQRTAIFDSVAAALRTFAETTRNAAERRIVILISDGLDTASTVRPQSVITDARSSGVSIYVIHLPLYAPRDGRLEVRTPARGFRDLALKTGGQYFLVGSAADALNPRAAVNLEPVFKAIEEDLQGQYVLGYYPGEETRNTPLHRIEVALNRAGSARKLRVQTLREEYNLKQ